MKLQVFHPERDIAGLKSGAKEGEAYMSVTGVKVEPKRLDHSVSEGEGEEAEASGTDEDGSSDDDEGEKDSAFKNSHRPRDESPNSKKVVCLTCPF
jgi:RIO kinase 1